MKAVKKHVYLLNNNTLPDGLGFRPANASDQAFIDKLFRFSREFLFKADAEVEYVNAIVEQQRQRQLKRYGCRASDATTMIIEKLGVPIGKIVVHFGDRVAHIFDLSLMPEARGNGYGKALFQAMQNISAQQAVPLGVCVEKLNRSTKQLYLGLGFQVAEDMGTHEFMLWYPPASHIRLALPIAN